MLRSALSCQWGGRAGESRGGGWRRSGEQVRGGRVGGAA